MPDTLHLLNAEHPLYSAPACIGRFPVARAAEVVARDVHALELRKKQGFSLQYISHLYLTCRILEAVGVINQLTLAAALLHDAIETRRKEALRGIASPVSPAAAETARGEEAIQARLTQALAVALQEERMGDTAEIAARVLHLVRQLTNDVVMLEGKRVWQTEHADAMVPRAKLIKTAEQMASLIDDLLLPTAMAPARVIAFADKALACCKACAGVNPLLDRLASVLHAQHRTLYQLLRATGGQEQAATTALRTQFSLDQALDEARTLILPEPQPATRWILHPRPEAARAGLLAIGMDAEGHVSRCQALVNPQSLEVSDPRNRALERLMSEIEAGEGPATHFCQTLPADVVGTRLCRELTIAPSMPYVAFLASAMLSDALDPPFQDEVRAMSTPSTE